MALTRTSQLFLLSTFWACSTASALAQGGDITPGGGAAFTPPPQQQQVQTVTVESPKFIIPQQPTTQIVPVNVLSNPAITPLDQRSGLIENAMNTANTKTPSGLGISSSTPQISNSTLLAPTTVTNTNPSNATAKPNFDGLGALLKSLSEAQKVTTTTSITDAQKKQQEDAAKAKLEQTQKELKAAQDLKAANALATAMVPAPTNTIVQTTTSLVNKAISLITGGSAASAAAAKPATPAGPDPVAIFQGAVLQAKLAQLKTQPILGSAIALKAAKGDFNNSSMLTTMTTLLSTPGLTKADAEFLTLAFLQATSKPGDIPVNALALICEQSTPGVTSGALNKSNVQKDLLARVKTMTTLAATLQTAVKNNPPAATAELKALNNFIGALTVMIQNLQSDLETMMNRSNSTIQSIMDAANSSSDTMKQLFQKQAN